MKIVIITGLSGAGKSQVVKVLEDIGYYCVDNMPPELIPKFAEIYHRAANPQDKAALVCDIRGGKLFQELSGSLEQLAELGYDYEILFLEASDEVLIKRYKETRRSHPLAGEGRIIEGIRRERLLLDELRHRATHIIDTSFLSTAQLKAHIISIYGSDKDFEGMMVHVISFGFKYGIPLDADLVFDVRFLPNPFYIQELRDHTGLETCVRDYVMEFPQSVEFLEKLDNMIEYLIPHYIKEGKSQLVIAIGCTGGHHRSVTIAEALYKKISQAGHHVLISHRDIQKGV
ncbi:RNase adapter RapZ [Ructibacterium gallinarum]|uniref:RNase adapter RapZ n=1 Tax=Ructibacterium gallinarum TaxID=2779355 RepID=A0A9D5M0S9_9FIRM|nr:RNase adapter RapZ [Ructibacterium gallinarum]MBE5039353.1 RNase adapter RapZ [Ructibacterium gallinarum]